MFRLFLRIFGSRCFVFLFVFCEIREIARAQHTLLDLQVRPLRRVALGATLAAGVHDVTLLARGKFSYYILCMYEYTVRTVVVVELLLLATTFLWPRRQSLSSLLSSSLDDNIADKSKPPLLPVSSMLPALFRNDISTPPCAPPPVVSADANTTVEL